MIKHKIRAKDGGTKIVSLTPIKALRYHCMECVGQLVPRAIRT